MPQRKNKNNTIPNITQIDSNDENRTVVVIPRVISRAKISIGGKRKREEDGSGLTVNPSSNLIEDTTSGGM